MTAILLVRHGATDAVGKRLVGRLPGVHLNAAGMEQAQLLPRSLNPLDVAGLYSSPLERAMETAEPLARSKSLQIRQTDALQEVDFGEFSGYTFEEMRSRPEWETAHTRPSQAKFPGGEKLGEVQERAVRFIENVRDEFPEGMIVCVSHADTIRLVLAHYLKMPFDEFHRLVIDPASISILVLKQKVERITGMNIPAGNSLLLPGG